MSQKEVDYYNVISRLIRREIKGSDAANLDGVDIFLEIVYIKLTN